MNRRTITKSSLLVASLLGAAAWAGSFTSNFSDPNQPGFTLSGGSRPNGDPYPAILKDPVTGNGYLALTFAENGELGSIVLDPLDPAGTKVGSFTATFKTRIGGGSSTPADGIAFYFGNAAVAGAPFGEEGPTDAAGLPLTDPGIVVAIDTYDNGGAEAPAIDVVANGVQIAHTPVDIFFPLSDTFVPVSIQLNANGTLNVSFKGTVIYNNLVLTGYGPITDGVFAIGARTGGLNENNWIDDLEITTQAAGADVAAGIQTPPQSKTIAEYASVSFSVLPAGTPPFTFQWYRNDAPINGANSATLTLNNVLSTENNTKYKVDVANALGTATSDAATLTVNADTTAPTIAGVKGSRSFDIVTVTFSEAVNIAGATFGLNNGLSISGKTQVSPTIVALKTSKQAEGTTYTLTVNGVKDLAGVPNSIAANSTADFSSFVWSPGYLTFEYWANINTAPGAVADLTSDPRYLADAPDQTLYMSGLNTRTVFPNDSHEYYGDRESGYLIPKANGDYRFFIYSDDASELWLSTDASPDNEVKIAEETGCCTFFTEPGTARTSDPISLVAGQRYAVMVLHKEGTGGDYAQIAWRAEGDATPAGQLTPISGEFTATYADPGAATVNITQQPANQDTTENKTATFTAAGTGSPGPVNYQWQRANPGSATFSDISGARGTSYTTPALKRAADNGAKYRVVVAVPGKSLASAEATLVVEIDNLPPTVTQAYAGVNLKSATVVFSEPVDPVTAGAAANYSVAGLTVTAATVTSATSVRITTSQQAEGAGYTVSATKVKDQAIPPNPIGAAGSSASFTSMVNIPNAVRWEAYTGLGGGAITDLTGSPKFPAMPDLVRLQPYFEGPVSFGDSYGSRLTGFITPKTSGNYVFFVATDDNGELWLSTDDTEENLARIAYEPNWAASRIWVGSANTGGRPGCDLGACENVSAPIALQAGKRYLAVLLQKEGGGGDNAAVAWKLEADADPADGAPPITSEVLSTAVSPEVLNQISLPLDQMSPLGSGNTAKPGFNVRVWQANQDLGGTALDQANRVYRAEAQLAGGVPSRTGPGAQAHVNAADLSGTVNGVFEISGTINWNQEVGVGGDGTEIGDFTSGGTPSRADQPIPGIPGVDINSAHVTDNIAGEAITYVEFPKAGIYFMGVNSDDGFKVTATDKPPTTFLAVIVHPPSSAAGVYYGVDAGGNRGGAFKTISSPVQGKMVAADPYNACSALNNAGALNGNVALITRGVCTFSGTKGTIALAAGATAVVMVNSRDIDSGDGMWPIVMGGSYVDLPGVMISKPDGLKLKAALDAGEELNVTIANDPTPALGEFDAGRGSSDTVFAFNVLQAGVYPLRCVWFEGQGGANLEWFTVSAAGNMILLNDTAAGGLKAYRARTVVPPVTPEIHIAADPSGTSVTLTFKGVLERADKVEGPYEAVAGATSPKTVTSTTGMKFYRTRR